MNTLKSLVAGFDLCFVLSVYCSCLKTKREIVSVLGDLCLVFIVDWQLCDNAFQVI